MKVQRGTVRADGTSTLLPGGVYDMTQLEPDVSPELAAAVDKALALLDPRETRARFKLEVFFAKGPLRNANVKGVVAVWTNGGYLHDGGDASVYLCPQMVNDQPCLTPLDLQVTVHGKAAVCPACRRLTPTVDLIGQLIFDVPVQRWAQLLVLLFAKLEHNADVRICIERESIHEALEQELHGKANGAAYARVASRREWIAYPLANIIADTASGDGLEARFKAFLRA